MRCIAWTVGGCALLFSFAIEGQEAPPSIIAPPNVSRSTDRGLCTASVDPGTAVIRGGGLHRALGIRSDSAPLTAPFPAGVTTITWSLVGAQGEDTSATQTITVNDTEAPLIAAPDMRIDTDTGSCSATPTQFLGLARDNCGRVELTGRRSDDELLDAPYPRGNTIISWTAADAAGNSSTTAQAVVVRDREPPQVKVPPDVEVDAEANECSAVVKVEKAEGTDNCGEYDITAVRSDGYDIDSTYKGGLTIITWTATDGAGLRTSADHRIVVSDREAPAIAAPRDVNGVTEAGRCVAFIDVGAPTASDNCPELEIESTRSDGKRRVDLPYPKGLTTIDWKVTDSAERTASAKQRVFVKDLQGPLIASLTASLKELWPANERMVGVKLSYRVEDICGGPVKTSLNVMSSEPVESAGDNTSPDWEIINDQFVDLRAKRKKGGKARVYTIFLTAIDEDGNQSTRAVTIPVAPPQP